MDDERFDIEAKLPGGAKQAEANEMLQALLAERFGLELHHEPRESSGFALVVSKQGPKLEEFSPPKPSAESESVSPGGIAGSAEAKGAGKFEDDARQDSTEHDKVSETPAAN